MRTLAYTNNAQSTLAASVDTGATTITVALGEGDRFPDIADEDNKWFPLTLISADGSAYEIVKATARSGDQITIVRAQESTPTPLSLPAGAVVSLRMTTAAFDEFAKSGDDSVLLKKGLNLSAQTNNSLSPMVVNMDGVNGLVDSMIVRFKPTTAYASSSPANVTLQINDLVAKTVKKLNIPNNETSWAVGELQTDIVHEFQYSAAQDVFYLVSPVWLNPATEDSLGLVRRLPDADATYDPNTDDEDAQYVDRKTASKITANFFATAIVNQLPGMWRFYGNGSDGDYEVPNAGQVFSSGTLLQYRNFKIPINHVASTSVGTVVIRATEKITIDGRFYAGGSTHYYPLECIGPLSAPEPGGATGAFPDYYPPQAMANWVYSAGSVLQTDRFADAVLQGISFKQLHGGHGRGHRSLQQADAVVQGRASIVLIAPTIEISSSAKFLIATRGTNSGTGATEGGGTVNANASQSGGGLLCLACEQYSIDAASEYRAESATAGFKTFANANKATGTAKPTAFAGAAPGQVMLVDLLQSTIEQLL